MINRVVLVGRFARDPNELRRSSNGTAVVSFTLAVDSRFARQGERTADFINCVVFGKSAEFVDQYCRKGSLVGVEGRIQTRSYDDRDGKKVFVTEVVCDSVQILESKAAAMQRQEQEGFERDTGFSQMPSKTQEAHEFEDKGIDLSEDNLDDEDLPF